MASYTDKRGKSKSGKKGTWRTHKGGKKVFIADKPKAKAKENVLSEREQIARLLDAKAKMRYGGTVDALDRMVNTQVQHGAPGGGIDRAYEAYNTALRGIQERQAASAQAAAAQQAQVAQAVTQTHGQVAGQQQAQQGGYGATGDPAAFNAALAKGAGNLAQITSGQVANTALSGANYLTGLEGIAGQERVQAGQRNQARVGELRDKRRELGSEMEAFKLSELDSMRAEAVRQELAEATLGFKQKDSDRRYNLALDALNLRTEDTAHDNQLADSKASFDQTKWNQRVKLEYDKLAARNKDKATTGTVVNGKKMTAAQVRQWNDRKRRVLAVVARFKAGKNQGLRSDEVSKRAKQAGFKADEINMARDLYVHGFLSAPNQAAAKAYFPIGHIPGGFTANHPSNKR